MHGLISSVERLEPPAVAEVTEVVAGCSAQVPGHPSRCARTALERAGPSAFAPTRGRRADRTGRGRSGRGNQRPFSTAWRDGASEEGVEMLGDRLKRPFHAFGEWEIHGTVVCAFFAGRIRFAGEGA